MFETSSILSMLGMGVQVKGAAQAGIASPGNASALQIGAGAGLGMEQQQSANLNGSVFQLMLSYALPQAGAAQAQAQSAPAVQVEETASTSIALPFKVEKSEKRTDEDDAEASMALPFNVNQWPVQWDAIAAAVQVKQADVQLPQDTEAPAPADALQVEGGQAAAVTIGMMKQQPGSGTEVRGNATAVEMMKQDPAAAQSDRMNAAVLELMKQQAPSAQDDEVNAAIAAMVKQQPAGVQAAIDTPQDAAADAARTSARADAQQNVAAPAGKSFAELALESSLGGTRVKETITVKSETQTAPAVQTQSASDANSRQGQVRTAETPAAPTVARNEKIIDIDAAMKAALQVKLSTADGETETIAAAANVRAHEIGTNVIPSQLSTNREAVVQNNSAAAKINEVSIPATVTQRGEREPLMLIDQQATIVEGEAASAHNTVATAQAATAASVTDAQQLQNDKTITAVEPIDANTVAQAAAPRKFNAAHAWAESVMRRITDAQNAQASAQKAGSAAETGTDSRVADPIGVRIGEVKTVVQPQAAANTTAALNAEVNEPVEHSVVQVQQKIAAAPETRIAVHEAVARMMEGEIVRTTSRTPSSAAIRINNTRENTDAAVAADGSMKAPTVPVPAAAVQAAAAPVKTSDDRSAQAKVEAAPETRTAKAELPTQQPLANVADVQRQFVPIRETVPAVTPQVREEVFEKIYKEVSAIKHTPTSVDVTLTPESLGTVTVKVGLEAGKMAARIDVQNVDVKHIIESNMPKLQEVLQSNGIALDTIGVFVNNGSTFAEKRQEATKKRAGANALKIDDGFEPLSTQRASKQYGYNTVEYIM